MTIQAILCILDLCLNFLAVASLSIRISSVLCFVLVTQSCLTLCDPMNYSPPGSSALGIFQERILEWVAMPSSRGSSQPRDRTQVSCIAGRFFIIWAIREALCTYRTKEIIPRAWVVAVWCFLACREVPSSLSHLTLKSEKEFSVNLVGLMWPSSLSISLYLRRQLAFSLFS